MLGQMWLSEKPHVRKMELVEERIQVLVWVLNGKPARTNLHRLILSGLNELPQREKRSERHIYFLQLATAVAWSEGLGSLDRRCWYEWKEWPLMKSASVTIDPTVRKLLGLSPRPSVWRLWVYEDWMRFKAFFHRVFGPAAA
jgi:hypothetical protein